MIANCDELEDGVGDFMKLLDLWKVTAFANS
jgi:hypothetical protein